jgi:hypothetical protein
MEPFPCRGEHRSIACVRHSIHDFLTTCKEQVRCNLLKDPHLPSLSLPVSVDSSTAIVYVMNNLGVNKHHLTSRHQLMLVYHREYH